MREKGPLRKINPNNILTGKILNDRKQSEIKKRLEGDHDREEGELLSPSEPSLSVCVYVV